MVDMDVDNYLFCCSIINNYCSTKIKRPAKPDSKFLAQFSRLLKSTGTSLLTPGSCMVTP